MEKNSPTSIPNELYGDKILGLIAVVGKNGAGKTSLVHAILQSDNIQSDFFDEKNILAIFYDKETEQYFIEQYQIKIEKVEGFGDIKHDVKHPMRKCFITNVFNWFELDKVKDTIKKGETVQKQWVMPATLLENSIKSQKKSYGYTTKDNQYLVNIQSYAEKKHNQKY